MYEKMRTENKIIQLIQNIALTISAAVLAFAALGISGTVGGIWKDLAGHQGPVGDVEGYAMIAEGFAGVIIGAAFIGVLFVLVLLAGITIFFWIMFAAAYSKKAAAKQYCICTGFEAGVKTALLGMTVLSAIRDALRQLLGQGVDGLIQIISENVNIGTLLCLLFLAGSIKVLWNVFKMKSIGNDHA